MNVTGCEFYENVSKVLDYDEVDGLFRWKEDRSSNAKKGDVAGSRSSRYNYIRSTINGVTKLITGHRLAWYMTYGRLPNGVIDHIDQNGLNNSISNLRECDRSENGANRGVNSNNKLGVKGVSSYGSKYTAKIQHKDKVYCLGTYATVEEASDAYKRKSKELYGDFSYDI